MNKCRPPSRYRVVFCGDKVYPYEEVPAEKRYRIHRHDAGRIEEIVRSEKADGIVCFISDCAFYAASVAGKLDLMSSSRITHPDLSLFLDYGNLKRRLGL